MSWAEYHGQSERLAEEAHLKLRAGYATRAKAKFGEAAELEARALECVPPELDFIENCTDSAACQDAEDWLRVDDFMGAFEGEL